MSIGRVFQILTLVFVLDQYNAVHDCAARQEAATHESQGAQSLGPFDLPWGTRDREDILTKIRAFLWERLSQRETGNVRVTFYTLEGDPTRWDFSVVPLQGQWCIRGEYISKTYFGVKKPKTARGRTDYCDAQRLDARTNLPVPQAEQRAPETYRLQLKGRTRHQDMNL